MFGNTVLLGLLEGRPLESTIVRPANIFDPIHIAA